MMCKNRLFLTLVLVFFAFMGLASPARAALKVGELAPAFTGHGLDGKSIDLAALKGRVVIVHFWATWCAPCQQEMPELETFYQHYKSQGVSVLALSVDRPYNRDDVHKAMRAYSFDAALTQDAGTNDFGTPHSIPVTYVIDADGVIRAMLSPDDKPLTAASLTSIVSPLLKK